MGKLTKFLLALALAGLGSGFVFVSGLVKVDQVPALYVTLPAGAIFFGLFLISLMLEKESARFDQEHSQHAGQSSKEPPDTTREPRGGRLISAKAT
jgi:hypothetical protein